MTRAELAELIATKLGVTAASRARDNVVPPGVLVEPGGREPFTTCDWQIQATVRIVAGRADDLDVWERYDDLVGELLNLFANERLVSVIGSVSAPTTETLGTVDYWTTTITVRLGT